MLNKLTHNSILQISKRTDAPKWLAWVVRLCAVVVAFIVSAIVSSILKPGTFGDFFMKVFEGNFFNVRRLILLLEESAILLLITLAVIPAFRMRFWNIGAEGQVLMGALMSVVMVKYLGGKVGDSALLPIMLLVAILGGACWAVIPAIFKAKWNTNETLFTLMMNYIAMGLVNICIAIWAPTGSMVLGTLKYGHLPKIGAYNYIINIIIVAIITVIVSIYLKYSKHGYELSVVGESQNTAKYIGISVPKVIIRTMLLSGALAGMAGWLLVGSSWTINTGTADGRGFTAILVAWLAGLNPGAGVFTAILVAFFSNGSSYAGSAFGFGTAFSDIITAVFFFVVIASEFIVNYKVKFDSTLLEKFKRKKPVAVSAGSAEISTDDVVAEDNEIKIDNENNDEEVNK